MLRTKKCQEISLKAVVSEDGSVKIFTESKADKAFIRKILNGATGFETAHISFKRGILEICW